MKVLKICIGTWQNASHDKRELSVCRELGAEVQVIAKGDVSGQEEMVDGFPVIRLSARPWGTKIPIAINRVVSLFSWASYIRKMKDIDVISGHDLSGLFIGWLSNFFKKNKAKLVYDSHEFTIGRDELSGKLKTKLIYYLEHFLIKRCAFSIMVNDSIASEVQKLHKLKEYPVVARNAAFYWHLDSEKVQETRIRLQQSFPEEAKDFIIMYHGAIAANRGIEQMLQAASELKNVSCVILGYSETQRYIDELQLLASQLDMSSRLLFHPAVSLDILPEFVAAVDVGMINILPTSKSFYYMLPNKFFENIQATTPIIVSDFPEVARLTDQYGIGLKVSPENISQITEAIIKMRDDKAFYATCKENIRSAKEELCWEKEKEKLKTAYRSILT